jgi:SHS2 domain-containing protein
MTYTLLPHDADVRAALSAPDLPALHASAVDLVRTLLVGGCAVAEREERQIEPAVDDEPERFFRFVRELLYLNDTEGFLPAGIRLSDGAITVRGECFDPQRHTVEHQVKALTRHGYGLSRSESGYEAQLVFDL